MKKLFLLGIILVVIGLWLNPELLLSHWKGIGIIAGIILILCIILYYTKKTPINQPPPNPPPANVVGGNQTPPPPGGNQGNQNQQNQQPIPQRSAWETFGNIVLILLIIAAIWGIIFGVQQFVKWVRDPTTDSTAKIDNGKPVSISWPDPKMSRKPDKADDDKKDKETDENQTKKDKNNNVSGNGYKPPRKQNKKVVINEPDPDSNWSNREPIRRKQKSEKEVIINEPQSGQWGY
jgi:hypothetical protein